MRKFVSISVLLGVLLTGCHSPTEYIPPSHNI